MSHPPKEKRRGSTKRRQSLCDALSHLISRGASRSRARGASRRRAGARGGRARAPAAAPPRASRARRAARAPSWRAAARGRRARAPAAGAPPRRRRAAARLRAGSRGRDWPSWPAAEPGSASGGELPSWHLCGENERPGPVEPAAWDRADVLPRCGLAAQQSLAAHRRGGGALGALARVRRDPPAGRTWVQNSSSLHLIERAAHAL